MSRRTSTPTAAAPWLTSWDVADLDLGSVDADQAPLDLIIQEGADGVRFQFARDTAAPANEATYVLVYAGDEGTSTTLEENPRIWFQHEFTVVPNTTINKTQDADNGGAVHMKVPVNIDLRGVPSKAQGKWYLMCASIGTAAQVNYLLAYQSYKKRPS